MGDSTPIGWIATVLYLIAGFVCASHFRHTARSNRPERRGWWLLACILLLLGLNKQLDLQLWLTIQGKELLRSLDLYDFRRVVQVGVLVAAALAVFGCALFAVPLWRVGSRRLRTALLGTALALSYVLLRAALFQKVASVGSHSLIPWLEPLGPLLVALSGRIRSPAGH